MPKQKPKYDRAGQFFRIYREWFESDAYRELNCRERCLLHELQAKYIPGRNEDVFLSIRDSAERLIIHPDTACKAFYRLEELGFIKLTKGELWQQKRAREWRLTFESYRGREPTDEWRDYKKTGDPKPMHKLSYSEGQSSLDELAKVEK